MPNPMYPIEFVPSPSKDDDEEEYSIKVKQNENMLNKNFKSIQERLDAMEARMTTLGG